MQVKHDSGEGYTRTTPLWFYIFTRRQETDRSVLMLAGLIDMPADKGILSEEEIRKLIEEFISKSDGEIELLK